MRAGCERGRAHPDWLVRIGIELVELGAKSAGEAGAKIPIGAQGNIGKAREMPGDLG